MVLRTSAVQEYYDRLRVKAAFFNFFFFFVFSLFLEIQKLIALCLYHFACYICIYHTIKPYFDVFGFSVKSIRIQHSVRTCAVHRFYDSRWACTKTRNNETKRPKRNHRNHRNDQNDRNETTETTETTKTTETKPPKPPKRPKRPKRNHRNHRNETTKMKTNTTNMIRNDRNKTTCERKTELFYM